MTEKDKKIIEDSEREGIPIFVLTAKDLLALPALSAYIQKCQREKCKFLHVDGIADRMREFISWKIKNPDKMKMPD